jgi:uncharacterized protein YndB with AHSA1/START domain
VSKKVQSTFVYVTYIRTTPEKLWSALTDAEFIKQYWFGMHCESQWTAGSSWKMVSGGGQIFDAGEIVEAEPPRRLVIRWQHQNKPDLKAEGESQCTVRRLAKGHLQPEVPVGDRLYRSAGPIPDGQSLRPAGGTALTVPTLKGVTMAKVIFGNSFCDLQKPPFEPETSM